MRKKKRKEKSFLKFGTLFIVPIVLFIGVYINFDEWTGVSIGGNNRKNIEYIADHINAQGKIIDYQNNLGAKGVDDIKLFVKDGNVVIHFGRIVLEWTMEDFVSEKVGEQIKEIGLTRYRDSKTGQLRVFWQNQELVRYAK